jgi:hypothetical protein
VIASPRPRAHLYVGLVVGAGIVVVPIRCGRSSGNRQAQSGSSSPRSRCSRGSFTVKVPSLSAKISVSEAFVFALVVWTRRRTPDRRPRCADDLLLDEACASCSGGGHRQLNRDGNRDPNRERSVLLRRQNRAWRNRPCGCQLSHSSNLRALAALLLDQHCAGCDLRWRTITGSLRVAQVHELYLSTVETLAMAVDAKDQITHGHTFAACRSMRPNSANVWA